MHMKNQIRTSVAALALMALPVVAQERPMTGNDTLSRQRQGATVGTVPGNAPATNPGFPQEVENRSTGYTSPAGNSSYQADRKADLDIGWIGLLGLAGLFGLRRGKTTMARTDNESMVHPHEGHPARS